MTNYLIPLRILLFGLALFAGLPVLAQSPPESAGPNINLVREAAGRYLYRTLSDGRERGREQFQLLVHPDGSRTLMIWHDLWARDAQFTVVLRVAASFRPLNAFASYWVANGYKGSATFNVQGNHLTAIATGPGGQLTQDIEVPEHFSIGTHPVSGDGWHLWYAQPADSKETRMINLYSLEATADIDKPPLGTLVPMPYEIVGDETITTPAGEFATTHYRLAGSSDLWVSGPDRLMVRMIQEKFDREYLLVDYSAKDWSSQ